MSAKFVKLVEGHEPFAVNPEQVVALQATHGGRQTEVIMTNGGTKNVMLALDEVLARFGGQKPADDWAG